MKNSQYVYGMFLLVNQEVNLIIFVICLPNPICRQFFVFIQLMALWKQAEAANRFPKSSYHINCSFRGLQFISNIVRLICYVLLCQRQGNHLIFCHWNTFSPVRQKIRCSPGPFPLQCHGNFPLPFPVPVSGFHLFLSDNPKPAVLDSYNSPLSYKCIFSILKYCS